MHTRKMKDETELFYAFLRQNGLKKTHQKDLILETFLATEGHLSVEDIYALVKRKDKKIGIVTVFRTLKSLTASGIAREITLGDGLTRFEHSYHHPHHHHIICTECHTAIEFVSPELEKIQAKIVDSYHFQPVHHRFQIYGVCQDCHEKRPSGNGAQHDTEKIFARDALRMALSMERRGLEFYHQAAQRNQDLAGRSIFERLIETEERHVEELQEQLTELENQEAGLDCAPTFLHFDHCELDRLVPDLAQHETAGELRLDARQSLSLALALEEGAAGYFRDFAGKFMDTRGKRIFERFADQETEHYQAILQMGDSK